MQGMEEKYGVASTKALNSVNVQSLASESNRIASISVERDSASQPLNDNNDMSHKETDSSKKLISLINEDSVSKVNEMQLLQMERDLRYKLK